MASSRTVLLAALALLLQDPPPAVRDLGPLLAERVQQHGMPAVAALVSRGDRTVAAGVAGVRVRGGAVPATLEDRWHVGSCTKSMTATLAAILAADGTIAWEATPATIFPDLAEQMDPAWQRATLARLLSNTSGAVGDLLTVHPELWSRFWKNDLTSFDQRLLLVSTLTALPPEKAPGTAYVYSNAGFSIAGAMLEKAAGSPYEELLRARLFAPLVMTSAGFGAPGSVTEPEKADAPWGHDARGRAIPPGHGSDNPAAITPAGRVHLTLEDWAKYARFHLRGARADQPELGKDSFARLHAPAPESGRARYAMGWIAGSAGDPPVRLLGHSGSNTMWYAVIWLIPELDLAILAACNDGAQGPAMERLVADLLAEFR